MLVDTFSCYPTFMLVELYASPAVALKSSNSEVKKNGEPQVMRIFFGKMFWHVLDAIFMSCFALILCLT